MSAFILRANRALVHVNLSKATDAVCERHLTLQCLTVSTFVGYDIETQFSPAPMPSDVFAAVLLLAQAVVEQLTPEASQTSRARAESLLRPCHREVPIP